MGSQLVGYKTACGHSITGPATLVNGQLRCPWHREWSQIVDVFTKEWHAKCKRCNFGRWAGQSQPTADIFANGHIRRNSGHVVVIIYETNPIAEATRDKFTSWQQLRTKS